MEMSFLSNKYTVVFKRVQSGHHNNITSEMQILALSEWSGLLSLSTAICDRSIYLVLSFTYSRLLAGVISIGVQHSSYLATTPYSHPLVLGCRPFLAHHSCLLH